VKKSAKATTKIKRNKHTPSPEKEHEQQSVTCPKCGKSYSFEHLHLPPTTTAASIRCDCGHAFDLRPHSDSAWKSPQVTNRVLQKRRPTKKSRSLRRYQMFWKINSVPKFV
jgi:hypothetical protein